MTNNGTPAVNPTSNTSTSNISALDSTSTTLKVHGARKWLLRLALMTVVPVLLLLVLELALRVGGYGYPTTFFIRNSFSGRAVYTDNPDFGLRFFPRALLRFAGPRVFAAKKPPNTYRIFVLGESAAEGVPAPAYSFSRILEVMLQERFPDKHFEVINTGTTAINSNVILPIARECAHYEPDLFVVYMGNNEVIGPYGPATVLSSYSPSLKTIRATVFMRSTKIGQLLNNIVTAFVPDEKAPQGWGGMAMFLKHRLSIDDPRLSVVYDHFQQNLNDICRAAIAANSHVLVSTVGVNLKDSAPFASLHRRDLSTQQLAQWKKLYDLGVAEETAHHYQQALQEYEAAVKIDNQFADLHFRLGRCYWALREYSQARTEYQQARDLDVVRFRTDSKLNNLVRQTVASKEMQDSKLVALTDTEHTFEQQSPYGVPGENLFYEHVHMSFRGNYFVARNILQEIEKNLASTSSRPPLAGAPLSESECARRLAFTLWDRYAITKTLIGGAQVPPFTNQLDHTERMAGMQHQLQTLEAELQSGGIQRSIEEYRQALQRRSDDWMLHKNLADILIEQGQADAAIEHLQVMRRQLPHSPWAARLLAEAQMKQHTGSFPRP